MKSGCVVIYNGTPKFLKALKDLPKHDVLVGIPEDKTMRDPEIDSQHLEAGTKEPFTNAAIGYIAEFGAPEANIPQRQWLQPSIEKGKVKISKYMKQAGKLLLEGNVKGADKAFHAAGMTAQNIARATVNTGDFQALAEATIKARLRRGRTGTKPLVDTGQFRNSISYVVRNG